MMSISRVEWIDIAKGIGIILMVIGHSSIPSVVSNWIWSFHMPLFFIISGILYNPQKVKSIVSFGKHKVKTLVVPYVFFLLIQVLFCLAWSISVVPATFYWGNPVGAFWFLQVLFVVVILNAIILKFFNELHYIVFSVILSLLGYAFFLYGVHLPYRLEVCGMATLFFCIGYMLKSCVFEISFPLPVVLLLICLSFPLSFVVPRLDMNYNCWGTYVPNVLVAVYGAFSIMLLSKKISNKLGDTSKIKMCFIWAGQSSLIIMGFSQPINMSIKYMLAETSLPHMYSCVLQHLLLWTLLYAISRILNKYTPSLIGK